VICLNRGYLLDRIDKHRGKKGQAAQQSLFKIHPVW